MPREIPFTGYPKESLETTLSDRRVRLTLRFGNLAGVWTIDIEDIEGDVVEPLLMGIPVVTGIDLLKPHTIRIGGIYARAGEGVGIDPGLIDIGSRVKLIHYTDSELAAL